MKRSNMSENELNELLKNELLEWFLNKYSEKDEKFETALNFVKRNTWDVIAAYSKDDWSKLDGYFGIGIPICNKINELKSKKGF